MAFVRTKDDIIDNVITFEKYIRSSDPSEKEFAENLLKITKAALVYKVENENHFAPSSFLAYKSNSMKDHLEKGEEEGREPNPELEKILKVSSFNNPKTEEKFLSYVESLGIKVDDSDRRYWRLKDSRGKNFNYKEEEFSS